MKAKKKYSYEPDYAVSPGETLREVMESYGMSQQEFATRLDLTPMTLNRIFRAEQPITYETANSLEMVTGTPARFWNNLEANYREQCAKLAEREKFEKDLDWLKEIPTRELIEREVIRNETDKVQLLHNTLSFYGVANVDAWRKIWNQPAVAARRSACFESSPGPASAWIRLGELQALQRECAPFDKSAFKKILPEIRKMTKLDPPLFEKCLIDLCASCGVALALVREMKKVPWNGATRWLNPEKVMLLLSLRGKGEDKFWFSFFHEAGHILHDSKKDLLINDGSHEDPRELRANEFATETLIPKRFNKEIEVLTSRSGIQTMARELGVSPGIVAGRFQFLTGKWQWFKDQIRSFQWS